PIGQKMRAVGGQEGFHARISPAGKIVLFPPRRQPRGFVSREPFRRIDPYLGETAVLIQPLQIKGQLNHAMLSGDRKVLIAMGYLTFKRSSTSAMFLFDLSRVRCKGPPRAGHLSIKKVEALWGDLAQEDASKAHRALCTLAQSPSETLAVLKEHVRPVPPSNRKTVNRLLGELDDRKFTARARAEKELLSRGELVLPFLRAALKGQLSAEVRQRME